MGVGVEVCVSGVGLGGGSAKGARGRNEGVLGWWGLWGRGRAGYVDWYMDHAASCAVCVITCWAGCNKCQSQILSTAFSHNITYLLARLQFSTLHVCQITFSP